MGTQSNHRRNVLGRISVAGLGLAGALSLGAISDVEAAIVLQASFDSQSGNTVNGITGGSGTLRTDNYNGNEGSTTIQDASPFTAHSGGYLRANVTSGSGTSNLRVDITPDVGGGLQAMYSEAEIEGVNRGILNGGIDLFFRSTLPYPNGSSGHSLFFAPQGGTVLAPRVSGTHGQSPFKVELETGANTLSDFGVSTGSQTDNQSHIIGVRSTEFGLLANTIYHFGLTFSTDDTGLVTQSTYLVAGTGDIDTTSDANLIARVTYRIAADNVTGFGAGAIAVGLLNVNPLPAPLSFDIDEFRIYDETPASFAALPVPEPTGLAGLCLAGAGMLARRRRRALAR